jgi:sensor domain CHASE-containing protein
MDSKHQKFIYILITALLLSIAFSVVMLFRVKKTVSGIEKVQIEQTVNRAKAAISSKIDTLEKTTLGWSEWDDAYLFTKGENPTFVDKYINEQSLQSLDVDVVGFISNSNTMLLSREYDPVKRTYNETNATDTSVILESFLSIKNTNSRSGLMLFQNQPMIISYQGTVKSDGTGESTGIIFMGQRLNEYKLTGISTEIQGSLELKKTSDVSNETEYKEVLAALNRNASIFTKTSGNNITAYSHFRVIDQKSAMILRVGQDISVYSNMTNDIRLYMIVLNIGLVICSYTIFLYTRKWCK